MPRPRDSEFQLTGQMSTQRSVVGVRSRLTGPGDDRMNVWAEAKMSQPQDIYVAPSPKKQLPTSPELRAFSRPW